MTHTLKLDTPKEIAAAMIASNSYNRKVLRRFARLKEEGHQLDRQHTHWIFNYLISAYFQHVQQ